MTDTASKLGPLIVFNRIDAEDPNSLKLLHRLENYAEEYVKLSPRSGDSLTVQGVHNFSSAMGDSTFPCLSVLQTSSFFFKEFRKTVSYYQKKGGYPSLIIAGDPWVGFLKCYFLKKFYFKKSEIQIQFHGDIYSVPKLWRLKESIKYFIIRLSLKSADSIRVVSNFQVEDLKSRADVNTTFVCAPIPLDFDKIPTEVNSQRSGMGLVGRLHKERGLHYFVSILEEMKNREIQTQIYIVGDGPEKEYLIRELEKLNLLECVILRGELSNSELKIFYKSLKVLLNCAPREGYGLTIREAALSGIQVVARNSKGVISAKQDFDSEIHLYDSVTQAVDLIDKVLSNRVQTFVDPNKFHLQEARNRDSTRKWAQSWVV
jgi:glycosyltransferase involved in cell wall biosynthesis